VANGEQKERALAREFLETVTALAYVPDTLRTAEIATAIDNLLTAHREFNNFHSEPSFARELQRLVGIHGQVPPQVAAPYMLGLVEVFLTNGHGTSWNAEPIYRTLLTQVTAEQALIGILSFTTTPIASRLQFPLCQQKFTELLDILGAKVSATAIKELIADVKAYTGPLYRLKDDDRIRRKVAYLQTILGPRAPSSS
jgi:hypothetical protein